MQSSMLTASRLLGCIALGCCLSQVSPIALAQEESAPPAPAAAPITVAPETTAPAPAAGNGNAEHAPSGLTATNGGLLLHFQDVSINAVLDELSAAGGFVVVKLVKPEGRISLVSRQPVDKATAVALLNTVLRNAGYAAVQQGRILKIASLGDAKKMSIPVQVGNDPAQIEPSDHLVTQVIPLRYADATQLKQDLAPVINPEADFTSNESSNALIITDTSANVRRVVQIVNALDTSLAGAVDVKIYQLKYANAANAAKLINDVFGDLETSGTQNPQQGGFVPPWRRQENNNNRSNSSRGQTSGRTKQVKASSDDRTNSVVVSGPSDTMGLIAQIVKELDSNPAADQLVYVYRLRNAQATNLESVLNNLFNSSVTTNNSNNNQNRNNNTTQRSNTNTSNNRNSNSGPFGSSSSSSNRLTSGRFGGTTNTGSSTRVSSRALQTAADLAGEVSIIADGDTNSILIKTAPTNYTRVKQVLDELDRPVAQVLIKVLIAEVTHDNGADIGAEFSILNLRSSGQGQEGGTGFNIPVAGVNATGLIVQVLESNFTATIRALETEGKLDVLSRPYILASDNQLASITVGQEVPFITNSRVTDSGQTINTIQYGDVGILLDVIPHINPDGLVILDVAPEISTLTSTTVPITDTVGAPVIAKRSAESRVGVKSGQTIVIGGLMEDRVTSTVNKVPLLGDIPLLGELFKRTTSSKTKTELLIFLTPHVAANPDDLQGMSQDEVKGTKLVPGAVTPGTYDEHLEGMQRGAATPAPAPARKEDDEPTLPATTTQP